MLLPLLLNLPPTYVYKGNAGWPATYKGTRTDPQIYKGARTLHP